MLCLLFVLVILSPGIAQRLTVGVTVAALRPEGQFIDEGSLEIPDSLPASLSYCAQVSNWYDGSVKGDYYCKIGPLLDEWAVQQKEEFCYMAFGEFIPKPTDEGVFYFPVDDYATVGGLSQHTIEDGFTYLEKYPDFRFFGSAGGKRSCDAFHAPASVKAWYPWNNTFAMMAIKLGNASIAYDDWKTTTHSFNIGWATSYEWGSIWKGKVFPCRLLPDEALGQHMDDQGMIGWAWPFLSNVTNSFSPALLVEAAQRAPPAPAGARTSMEVLFVRNPENKNQKYITVYAPINVWFGFATTTSGGMVGGVGVVLHLVDGDMVAQGVVLKSKNADDIVLLDDLGNYEMWEYEQNEVEQKLVLTLTMDVWTNVQLLHAFGLNEVFGYHFSNRGVMNIPME